MPTPCDDLATKAELQELRDQLNAVIGEKEDGSTEIIFAKGNSPALAVTALAPTLWVLTKTRAAESIKDIIFSNSGGSLWDQFAKGVAKVTKLKGNNTQSPIDALSDMGKGIGQNRRVITAFGKPGGGGGAGLGVLANLVSLGGTLAINTATVKILDKRIEAEAAGAQLQIDVVQNGMIRLYQKHQGNIEAIQAELNDTKTNTEFIIENLGNFQSEIENIKERNTEIQGNIELIETDITDLKAADQQLRFDLEQLAEDNQEAINDMQRNIDLIQESLETAQGAIEAHRWHIAVLDEEIEYANTRIAKLEQSLTEIETELDNLQIEFGELKLDLEDLRLDVENQFELLDSRVKTLEGKVVLTQELLEQRRVTSGGVAVAARIGAENQINFLKLLSKLTDIPIPEIEIFPETVLNQDPRFQTLFDTILEDINAPEMQKLLLEELIVPKLETLIEQTTEDKISQGTEKAICKSLNNPNPCPSSPDNLNPTNGLKGLLDKLEDLLDIINLIQDLFEENGDEDHSDIFDKLQQIYEAITIDISGTTKTEFICLEDNPEQGEQLESTNLVYQGQGLTGLHQLTKTINNNLLTVFQEICQKEFTLASPDWWQVRLGGNVPQIVCTFRRGATRTYHSLSIPHPLQTQKPENALIPEYTKGNWQGMIVLTDNSKFIVNCDSSAEAERICNIAASLIDSTFLPTPFKVWLTERKGEPVASDPMKPTSIMYYSTGQRNSNPDWYMAIPKDNPV